MAFFVFVLEMLNELSRVGAVKVSNTFISTQDEISILW